LTISSGGQGIVLSAIIQIMIAIIVANLYEWVIHKHVLHGLGKKKNSSWSSHWSVHHRNCRQNENFDQDYLDVFGGGWSEGAKEIVGVLFLAIIQIPTFFVFPWYAGTSIMMAGLYFFIHRKAHLDIDWCKKWVPWHYDHHMGKDQDKNWGVTLPLWDYILGTRVKL
tara:strand:- start:6046 stop:6546 length:501 start_codon:yes stop_codon:yes gene_type:complete